VVLNTYLFVYRWSSLKLHRDLLEKPSELHKSDIKWADQNSKYSQKDITSIDNIIRDTEIQMSGIRTDLNAYAQNVFDYHTEVFEIRDASENPMATLESKFQKHFLDVDTHLRDTNLKVDTGLEVVNKEFMDISKQLEILNKRFDKLHEPIK